MTLLLFATTNRGKQREVARILEDTGWRIAFPQQLDSEVEVEETGTTFLENARLKAYAYHYRHPDLWVAAEDSGIVVPSLGGEPGVYSARYGGRPDDVARNEYLLERLHGFGEEDRRAYYRAVVILLDPQGRERIFEGRVDGLILEEPRGEAGFGYDPLFYHPKSGCTFAQLPPDAKNRLSHRGMAIRALKNYLVASRAASNPPAAGPRT